MGSKNTYKYLGKRIAENGKVAVLINYPLGKKRPYSIQAENCASAFNWVYRHIDGFSGDSNRIFISGHSAGAHLAALISLDTSYLKREHLKNPVKGIVLIDAFGLNMHTFFNDPRYNFVHPYFYPIFSMDSLQWDKGSPVKYITQNQPPMLIAVGAKTIKSIKETNRDFFDRYSKHGNKAELIWVKHKRHIGMILQFRKRRNPLLKTVVEFIDRS